MNNITKTGIGIITAGAIIGGTVLVSDLTTSEDNLTQTEQVSSIDWSQYDLNIPDLDIPDLDISDLGTDIDLLSDYNEIINNISLNDVKLLDEELENAGVNSIDEILMSIEDNININKKQLSKMLELQQVFSNNFKHKVKDQRSLSWDNTIGYSESILKWAEIYDDYSNVKPIEYKKIKNNFRMISEIIYPESEQELNILTKNLEFYSQQGYNAVLLTFNGEEQTIDLVNLVRYIKKNTGMQVWFTYSGMEDLNKSIYIDPDKYSEILTRLAKCCDGYINSWRRTSGHLLEQDEEFKNFTNITLRKSNIDIPIVGELYYGETHRYTGNNKGYALNSSKNISALYLTSFGFHNINISYLIKNVIKPKIGDVDVIGLVVGSNPYYLSSKSNGLDYEHNIFIKSIIEQKFMKAGCIGTITLHNDGSDNSTNKPNNLSKILYNQL